MHSAYSRPMKPAAPTGTLRLSAAVSGNPDSIRAASQVCERVSQELGDGVTDLALVFISGHHVAAMESIGAIVRRELRADCALGVSAESVVGGSVELERTPGISVLAARLPGVMIVPFSAPSLQPFDEEAPDAHERIGRAIGAADDLRATLLFVDPFSVPMTGLLPAICRSRVRRPDNAPIGVVIGGFASAGSAAGQNALLLDDTVFRAGAIGVSLRGPVRVETVVSQGCRGFGQNYVITGVRKNVILTLGGRPALQVLREAVEELPESDRPLLEKGLFIGRVINEYKERFGRDDYLIRNVAGVEESSGAVAVADFLRVGQTVRFHLRDAATAHEDLAMLLDAQQLKEPPVGGLLVTCNGRGTRLFDKPHHDAAAIARAFRREPGGETLAKLGEEFGNGGPSIPLAGFFAAGEIGPVGEDSYVHGHTACVALFRGA